MQEARPHSREGGLLSFFERHPVPRKRHYFHMASHNQARGDRASRLAPIRRGAEDAKHAIEDVLYRMAERYGLPSKAAEKAASRHLDEMLDDMIREAEDEGKRPARTIKHRH